MRNKFTKVAGFLLSMALLVSPASTAFAQTNGAKIGTKEYPTLVEAINVAQDGETITVTADATLGDQVTIAGKTVTLDLNGFTVTSNASYAFFVGDQNGASGLTVKDSSTGSTGKVVATAVNGTAFTAVYNSTLTLEEGVDVEAVGPSAFGYNGATLNTAANLKTTGNFAAVTGNGSAGHNPVEFNITGGTIYSQAGGVYFPNKGTLNISGGTIGGDVGVYVKAGTTNISGDAVITGNGAKAEYLFYGNGFNSTGDALVVDSCNYPGGEPSVNITGGTFDSKNASAIGRYKNVDVVTDPSVKVSGGNFSNEVPQELRVAGYVSIQNADNTFSVHMHTIEEVAEQAATCTDDGMKAHYYCALCGKYYSDAAGTTEVTAESLVIPKDPHALVAVAEKPATCTAEGVAAHYECTVCGKVFSDAAGTMEVKREELVIPKVAHVYQDGKCTVCGEADPNYVAKDAGVADNSETISSDKTASPKTGDNGNSLFLTLMCVSVAGVAVVLTMKKIYAKR